LLSAFAFNSEHSAFGQSVWSGFDYSFSKALFADPNLPANQDRITNSVWLTRGTNQGIYNIQVETAYADAVSPSGTRWATERNNPGKTIAATNWNNLAFTDWVTAYGGQGSMDLPNRLLTYNAVVNLVADNTYLDLRFTDWSAQPGGAFAYERAPAPLNPTPTGDYNLNGVVDAADYVLWRETLTLAVSPAGSGADGNSNGTIDSGDYDFWWARFGNAVGSGSANSPAAVPEPTVAVTLAFAVQTWVFTRRRRR
ncbi:MAG: hypothetical protein IT427_06490, partial [Pirellulales bacterium]|nr:hypothetical protein [Pirellulales bacterium]